MAEALIQLQVLPSDLDAAWFWPGSFASGQAVDELLLPGASFLKEVGIVGMVSACACARLASVREAPQFLLFTSA